MKTSTLTALFGVPFLFFFTLFLQPFAAQAQDECGGYEVELFITGDADISGGWAMIDSTGVAYAGDYDGGTETVNLCLEGNCYNMSINILAMGDQEGYWVLLHADTAVVGGYLGDTNYVITFGLDGGCEGVTIFGCTDPAALNYDPNATMDGNGCLYDEEECDLNINVIQQTCGHIQLSALTPNPPFPAVNWSVNGVSVSTLPGSVLSYQLDGVGDYEFCASVNDGECEVCETIEITQGCDEDCGELSIDFVNEGDPDAGCVAWFAPVFDGDLQDGIIYWDMGAGSTPVLSNDTMVGYQYGPGTYELCATYFSTNCSSTYCMEVTIDDCTFPAWGCTDPEATNYNPEATVDDGSCIYDDPECSVSFYAVPDSTGENILYIVMSEGYADADSVYWSFGDGNYSEEFYPTHTYDGAGPYELCVYALFTSDGVNCWTNFCMEVDESLLVRMQGFTIQVAPPEALSAAHTEFAERLELWPNPASEQLHVGFMARESAPMDVRIFDLSGKMVHSQRHASSTGDNLLVMPLGQLGAGMYLLQLSGDRGQSVRRFAVTR